MGSRNRGPSYRAPLGVFALVLVAAPGALARPFSIEVRAAAQLRVRTEPNGSGGLDVHVTLVDDAERPIEPVGPAVLGVEVVPIDPPSGAGAIRLRHVLVGSGADLDLALSPGRYRIRMELSGQRLLDVPVLTQSIDVARPDLTLGLSLPDPIDLGEGSVTAVASADPAAEAAGLSYQLDFDGTRVAQGTIPASGRWSIPIATASLGRARLATARLSAQSDGDARRAGAETSVIAVLRSPVVVALEVAPRRVARDGRLVLSGTVRSLDGAVKNATLVVVADSEGPSPARSVATFVTDARGRFREPMDLASLPSLPEGRLRLFARHLPRVVTLGAATAERTVTVAPPQPIPLYLLFVPVAATFLALLVAFGFPSTPRALRRRPARPAPEPAPEVGLVPSSSRTSRTSRRPTETAVGGQLLDAIRRRPVAGGRVRLRAAGGETEIAGRSDAAGAFAIEAGAAGAGACRLVVEAEGFVPLETEVVLPHNGSLRGVRILLVPLRWKVMEIYREVVLGLSEPGRWGYATPRELARSLRLALGESSALGRLTRLYEEVYYGWRLCEEEDLAQARALAARIQAEVTTAH